MGLLERIRVDTRGVCKTCGNLVQVRGVPIGCEATDKLILPEFHPYHGNNKCALWKEGGCDIMRLIKTHAVIHAVGSLNTRLCGGRGKYITKYEYNLIYEGRASEVTCKSCKKSLKIHEAWTQCKK